MEYCLSVTLLFPKPGKLDSAGPKILLGGDFILRGNIKPSTLFKPSLGVQGRELNPKGTKSKVVMIVIHFWVAQRAAVRAGLQSCV